MSSPKPIAVERIPASIRFASAYDDNFFVGCLMLNIDDVVDGLIGSFLDWFSFYFIGIASVFLLIAFPIIFFFQAPGKQRKMQNLYNKSRLSMIKFMFSCSFSILASLSVGWITKQQGPCLYVDKTSRQLYHFGLNSQLPSIDIVVQTVITTFLFQYGHKKDYYIDETNEGHKFITRLKMFFSAHFMKILGFLFIACFCIIELIYGKSNVLQVLFSISFGVLIDSYVTIFPVIVPMITSLVCFIAMTVYLILQIKGETLYPYNIRVIIFDTFSHFSFSFYMLICFIVRHSDFSILDKFSQFLSNKYKSDVFNVSSTFAETLDESDEVQDMSLAKLLLGDMKDSVIAVFLYVAFNFLREFIA